MGKKSKNKTFYVSETIYVCVDIEAASEEEALEKYEAMMSDKNKRSIIIGDSENDIEVNQA